MTVDPIQFVRRARRTKHAIRDVAMATVAAITIAACSSGSDDEPAAASTPETSGSTTPPPPTASTEDATTTSSASVTGTGSLNGEIPVTFTVPAGWENIGWGVIKGDPIYGLLFMEVGNTFSDPCQSVALDPPVGPTVDDLASVWGDLADFDATLPTDITVDGFDGKLVEFTVPDYNADDCVLNHFILLEGVNTPGDGYWAQGPNQTHQLRILDIDGSRVVIGATWFPDTSAQDRADIEEMLDSIQIG